MQLSYYAYLFHQFLVAFNVTYNSSSIFEDRFHIFAQNMDFIEQYNAKQNDITLGITVFADKTRGEFLASLNIFPFLGSDDAQEEDDDGEVCPMLVSTDNDTLPTVLDWRQQEVVTPIKDQGSCGSCWAFATVETVESRVALDHGHGIPPPILAPQQLVDCSTENYGCSGGSIDSAMQYLSTNGVVQETEYSYVANDEGQCRFVPGTNRTLYKPGPCFRVTSQNEKMMKQAVVQQGPLTVTIDASAEIFQFYTGGIIYPSECDTELNHAVQLVGYNDSYWIVRNSWGELWGEKGYFRVARGEGEDDPGTCGIAMGVWGFSSSL
jgi:C1A family cysteine protease